jgi:2,3-bisphosphoglycerate-independent phosphoglycerate mutase
LKPEMSALELTEAVLAEIKKIPENPGTSLIPPSGFPSEAKGANEVQGADFICLNYANADMVGHTGFWNAVIKAVETVDRCVEKIVTAALENGYTIFLTADHGNADFMINEDGSPNTAHTLNPVPFFIIDREWHGKIKPGKLGDIAPTILTLMGIPIPKEMTGNILIDNS